jgi:hypothetical protein
MATGLSTSWPGLCRPSTSLERVTKQDVDARDEPGHDEEARYSYDSQSSPARRLRRRSDPPRHAPAKLTGMSGMTGRERSAMQRAAAARLPLIDRFEADIAQSVV